jgi:hypothetical protein
MGVLDELQGVLKQYQSGQAPAPAAVAQHFDQVAQSAPQSTMAAAISHALSSDQTPPLGQMVSSLFNQATPDQKAGMVNRLLTAIGPTAAGALTSSGVLAGITGTTATAAQAQALSPDAVKQLADQAQRADGTVVDKLGSFYAQHPTLVKSLGAGALALMMSHMSRRT